MSTATAPCVEYPSSDGKPMAENTWQYNAIVTLVSNIADMFSDRSDVFVAGDNLIYPVEGDNTICMAPDVYVAFGRPNQHRPSYLVWNEGGIFPQVIFEVLSDSNRPGEMKKKLKFYELYGAQEYYVYDPKNQKTLEVYVRENDRLKRVNVESEYQSPMLEMIFRQNDSGWSFCRPDGSPFLTNQEIFDRSKQAERKARTEKRARRKAELAQKEAEQKALAEEQARKEAEAKLEFYKAKLRKLGLEEE